MSNSGDNNALPFSDPKMNATESLMTVADLKSRYLFGVELTNKDGNEMPDEVLQFYLDSAVSYLEMTLDLSIRQRNYIEKQDYRQTDYQNFAFMRLYHYPVVEVNSLKGQFPLGVDAVIFPRQWIRIYEESGELQLVPTIGSVANFPITSGSYFLPHLWSGRHLPQFFICDYIAGFEDGEIPYLLNHAIGLVAAIGLLDILGELLYGPGITTKSLGIDGLTQSIGTNASATSSAYSARIESYRKQLEQYMVTLRNFYKGLFIAVT